MGNGRKIHALAEKARESGNPILALKLTDEATIEYQKENDLVGLAEVIGSRLLAFRHLFDQTGSEYYLILAKHSAMAAVEIARKSGDSDISRPLFDLAKAFESTGDYKEAVRTYQESLENIALNTSNIHNRPGVIADMNIHITTCEYKAGDKSALQRAEKAIADLEVSGEKETTKYNFDVWLSGGHMRIAEMLRVNDPEKAKKHLQVAKKIIDASPELKIRLGQWQHLADTFK